MSKAQATSADSAPSHNQLDTKAQAWSALFSEPMSDLVKRYTSSVFFDKRLWQADIAGSLAHAEMLAAQGIISASDHASIQRGMAQITSEIESGAFEWKLDLEDVHLNIEARLTQLVGDAGKRLHTGRSRNDQVATDVRLWLRGEIDLIGDLLKELQVSLVDVAEQNVEVILPGFTHLQVGEAGQDHLDVLLSHIDQRHLQLFEQVADQINLAAQPQAHVGGDLVIAAAACVQALARIAHQLGQAGFDVQVHVFQVELPFKGTGLDLGRYLRHAALDGGVVGGRDDALRGEHLGMCQAACNIGLPQALVEEHAGGVALDQVAHGLGKQRRPGLGLGVELVVGRRRVSAGGLGFGHKEGNNPEVQTPGQPGRRNAKHANFIDPAPAARFWPARKVCAQRAGGRWRRAGRAAAARAGPGV